MQVLTNKTRRDRYLIADFELTCWEAAEPPEGMKSEIISIGIVEIDTKLHEIVRDLLGMHMDELKRIKQAAPRPLYAR